MRGILLNIIIIFFVTGTGTNILHGQPVTSPEQVALGGAVTYVTGSAAHFYNPANLMIRSNRRPTQITMGMGGLYSSKSIPVADFHKMPDQVAGSHFLSVDLADSRLLSDSELINLFEDGNRYYEVQQYDIIPAGISWRGSSHVRSLAFRSRGISSFEMSRDWFALQTDETEEDETVTRFLNEKYQVYHEISFGIAREATMFNRWQAGLNTLLLGFSPKVIAGGMYAETQFQSDYHPVNDTWQNVKSMDARLAGDMAGYSREVRATGLAQTAFSNHIDPRSNFRINGLGVGLDAGLTYIIPLGNDISLSPHIDEPLRKSLRFSLSLTDFGVIRYYNEAQEWRSSNFEEFHDDLPVTNTGYSGKPGEFFHYLSSDSSEAIILNNLVQRQKQSFTVQLPTELHMGAAFQYNRITSTLDLNYRFHPADFQPSGWRISAGTELRILSFLPLMGSIQLKPGNKQTLGMGAGLDLGLLQVTGAIRLTGINNDLSDMYTDTVSLLGLQVRF